MRVQYPITKTIANAIYCKDEGWGKNNIPVYYVKTPTALNQLVGYVKFINSANGTVLYRGQDANYPSLLPSGCRCCKTAVSDELISAICSDEDVLNFFKLNDSEIAGWEQYKSIVIESALQHYGADTYCMDFVDNHWCSLWFGLYKFENSIYVKREEGFLYLYMYLADTNGPCVRGLYIGEDTYTVDLRKAIPSYFSRPTAQHGWIVRRKNREFCSYDDKVVCVAKIHVSDAAKWLGEGELLSQNNFFPDYEVDQGYSVLLKRQSRSGIFGQRKGNILLPPLSIKNYHQHKSIFYKTGKPINSLLTIKPICSVFDYRDQQINNVVDLFSNLLSYGWTKDTCDPKLQFRWSEANPCFGHSAVTAILIQKLFGGEIFSFNYSNWNHYFNIINDEVVDLTYHEIARNMEAKYNTAKKLGKNNQIDLPLKHKKNVEQLLDNCRLRII